MAAKTWLHWVVTVFVGDVARLAFCLTDYGCKPYWPSSQTSYLLVCAQKAFCF